MADTLKLRTLIDISGVGLEIGPSFDPVVPKREGHRVEIVDHLSAADLRRKYADAPGVALANIEEVDHVADGRPLLELIGKPAHYDYIVASHVVEHTVDLMGFLLDCQGLLKPGGTLALAVPDMRFAFDCLRPPSTTGQVLQAHADGGKRHAIGKLFDELAHNCVRGGAIGWTGEDTGELTFFRPLAQARDILAQYRSDELTRQATSRNLPGLKARGDFWLKQRVVLHRTGRPPYRQRRA